MKSPVIVSLSPLINSAVCHGSLMRKDQQVGRQITERKGTHTKRKRNKKQKKVLIKGGINNDKKETAEMEKID